jgi:hypothetical protein
LSGFGFWNSGFFQGSDFGLRFLRFISVAMARLYSPATKHYFSFWPAQLLRMHTPILILLARVACRSVAVFAALMLFLLGCRGPGGARNASADSKEAKAAEPAAERTGRYLEITGAATGSQKSALAVAIALAISRLTEPTASVSKPRASDSELQRDANKAAELILEGQKLSFPVTGVSTQQLELVVHDLRAAGLTVKPPQ